jgi:chlorobactene glucosyltransferase
VLIPARNEAAVIASTVHSLLTQTTPHFELLVLDDHSTDHTAAIAQQAAGVDPRLKIIQGQPLPAGWLGKNWACHQLSQQAQGELLLFLDADVKLHPAALTALLSHQASTQADLLTIWPTQMTLSWGEKLVVPLMKFAILSYLPLPAVHHSPFSAFAAANGQCLLFTRSAYQTVGGHTAVRQEIVEDVQLAKKIKQAGLKLRMADGAGLVACRMYESWAAVRQGFGKNILAGHGQSLLFLLFSTCFHWLLFIYPWVWLAAGGGLFPAGLIALAWLLRFMGERYVGARPGWAGLLALLMPVSVGLMTLVAGQAVVWHFTGGPQWKGRTVKSKI